MSEGEGGAPRTWTIYVCPQCGKAGTSPVNIALCSCVGAVERVVVVEQSRYKQVEAELEDARDRLIEIWHSEGPPLIAKDTTLHGFLGMTWEQYKAWVEAPGFASSAGPGGRE